MKPRPEFVTEPFSPRRSASADVQNPVRPEANRPNLPLDWLFNTEKDRSFSDRVVARLIQAETHEALSYFRDDYRMAQLIVLHCERGDAVGCTPHVLACYEVLGCHPDHVYARVVARRRWILGEPVRIGPCKNPQKGAARISPDLSSEAEVRDSLMSGVVTGPGAKRRVSEAQEGRPSDERKLA